MPVYKTTARVMTTTREFLVEIGVEDVVRHDFFNPQKTGKKRQETEIKRTFRLLLFFRSPSPTPLLLPFCAGIQFSRRSHHVLIDRKKKTKKKKEKIEGCEQSIRLVETVTVEYSY